MDTATATEHPPMPKPEPQKEHIWLQRLVGEWTYETEAVVEPGQPPSRFTGTESVRALGDLWIVGEGRGESPGGGTDLSLVTLGYDPQKQRFVGTWLGSMMTYLWTCEGFLDADERVLTLECEGPSMEVEGKLTSYQDIIELQDNDRRTLTAKVLGTDGQWTTMMTARYRRRM